MLCLLTGAHRGCVTRASWNQAIQDRASPLTKSSTAKRIEGVREAYVDTSAFIAFLDRSDSYHPLFRRLFSEPPPLVTSALVVAEGHGWFLRRYDGNRAIQFLQ